MSMFQADTTDAQRFRVSLIHSAERAIAHNMDTIIRSAEWFELALRIAGASILGGVGLTILWAARQGGSPF
jgi:hypothetical protein